MPKIGSISEFDPSVCDFKIYIERLSLFFDANSIEESKRVPVLLTLIGDKCYGVLRDLISPDLPTSKTFDQIVAVLTNHYSPAKSEIAERFKFLRRKQGSGESISEYVAGLKKLVASCNYGTFLDNALRDKFVEGISDVRIQRELLQKERLSFTSAIKIALAFELTNKTAIELKQGMEESPVMKIHASHKRKPNFNTQPEKSSKQEASKVCYRCKGQHLADRCRFKSYKCNNCHKLGHLARACRVAKVNALDDTKPEEQEEFSLYNLHDRRREKCAPIKVELSLNDKPILMEVDTGSAATVMSESTFKANFPNVKLQHSKSMLFTYSKEQLKLLGEVKVKVKYDHFHDTLPLKVVQGYGPTLLGRDWLQFVKLDWRSILKVIDLDQILEKFSAVFSDTPGSIKEFTASFLLQDNVLPKFFKARPVPYAMRDKVSKQLDAMEKQGILEKTDHSKWATPIVCIPKKEGKIRICGDYRSTVNKSIQLNSYPFPTTQDLFATLSGGKKFTKLDLSGAYEQVEVAPEQQDLLTINTHKGLYKVKKLLYGISAAPAIFQKIMDTVLKGISYVGCLLDDIIITGSNDEEHLHNLNLVFERLSKFNIKLNRNKCSFLQEEIEYLGHRISANGISMTESKIEAMQNAPVPRNVSELRSFLGLINYYCNFIGNLSSHLKPLYDLLGKNTKFDWSTECQNSFEYVKTLIVSDKCLTHYDPNKKLRLATDASSYGLGAVLSHVMSDGRERPIAFASRTLSKTEKNYSQIEREALSIVFGVLKFHMYLCGRKFHLLTDHKPLTILFGNNKQLPVMAAARIQRWAMLLCAYDYDIEYRSSKEHCNADFLSRVPCTKIERVSSEGEVNFIDEININASDIVKFSKRDQIINKVMNYVRIGWPNDVKFSNELKPYFIRKDELSLEQGCLLWGLRVVIPESLRNSVLKELHSTHIGIVRTKMLARSYLWWPKLDGDIETMISSCNECQMNKTRPSAAPLSPWPTVQNPWERIHVDYLEYDKTSYLIVVDAYSKWPEIFKMGSTTSFSTIEKLRFLFASYGLPKILVSDNGPQLVSAEFKNFLTKNGVVHLTSAAYKARQNGQVERFVQIFKSFLRKNVSTNFLSLARFLFSFRNTPHTLTGKCPSTLFLNREVRNKFSLILPDSFNYSNLARKFHNVYDNSKQPRTFQIGDFILFVNDASDKEWKRGKIIGFEGNVNYKIESEGRIIVRHVDQIVNFRNSFETPDAKLNLPVISDSNTASNVCESTVPAIDKSKPLLNNPSRDVPNNDAGQLSNELSSSEEIPTVTPRYPQRIRKPPNRLSYS